MLLLALAFGFGCEPADASAQLGRGVQVVWDQGATVVTRDNFHPSGVVLTSRDEDPAYGYSRIFFGARSWDVELGASEASGSNLLWSFGPTPGSLPVALLPGQDNWVHWAWRAPTSLLLAGAVEGQQNLPPPPEWLRYSIYGSKLLQLDPRVTVIPVYTWNLGGAVAGIDGDVMKVLFDKAPETVIPADVWGLGRVDEVWDQCFIQFRHVGHSNVLGGYPCWTQPVVSNRSSMVSTCYTGGPACRPNGEDTQNFFSCSQQEQNLCTLWELVRYSREQRGYGGPKLFVEGAINVYFAPQLHLYEGTTLGIGCAGSYPMVVINALWKDYDGLRVAHELGHVLGFDSHANGTVMGDVGERSTFLSSVQCQRARSYLQDSYDF